MVLWHHPGDPLEWSRDGTKLLIDGFNAGFFVVDSDGSATRIARGTNSAGGTFTRDGSAVIYSRLGKLYRVSAHGGRAHLIARESCRDPPVACSHPTVRRWRFRPTRRPP